MIGQHFSYQKHWNSTYSNHQLLDYLTDSCILGLSRFDHMEALRSDLGYKKVKDVSEVPSEGRYRDLLSHLEGSHLKELLEINQDIIRLKSQWEGPREVWHFYNKRGNCENRIDEIKVGFGVEENSQHEILRNRAFAMVKVIAYNLVNWFKRVTLPGSNYEVQTNHTPSCPERCWQYCWERLV